MAIVSENSIVKLWLDSYEEMFSDFDPRPLSKRAWSDDFIFQIKKALKEHQAKDVSLFLLLPTKEKDVEAEKILASRLLLFFEKGKTEILQNRRKAFVRAGISLLSGMAIMLITGYLTYLKKDDFSWHLVMQIFEPAGWFLVWTGLDILVTSGKSRRELSFYEKMSNAEVRFGTY